MAAAAVREKGQEENGLGFKGERRRGFLFLRNRRTAIGSDERLRFIGLDPDQAGLRFPGPGPGCGLGTGEVGTRG
jgi:hypothetical protein